MGVIQLVLGIMVNVYILYYMYFSAGSSKDYAPFYNVFLELESDENIKVTDDQKLEVWYH